MRKRCRTTQVHVIKRAPAFLGALTLLASGGMPAHAQTIPNVANAIDDANWILGAVVHAPGDAMDGAISQYPDASPNHVNPYFGNYAAIGLARATAVSSPRNNAFVNAAWAHCAWYATHADASGYVHDWDKSTGTWTAATGPGYDSTDAYAATFLLAVYAANSVSPDSAKLTSMSGAISTAITAIHNTQDTDGLTYSTPAAAATKLVEDNAESYQGLLAGAYLATALGNTTLASQAASYASAMKTGIGTLWSTAGGYFYWAEFHGGALQATSWSNLTPDAMAQGWASAFKIATPAQSSTILSNMTLYQPTWDHPELHSAQYDVSPIGWAYYFSGDTTTAQNAATHIRAAAIAANRAWWFTVASAGNLIVLETNGEDGLFAPSTALAAPTGLIATAGNAQVSLSWTASAGTITYNVYRGTTPGGESATPIATGITGTTYMNTGLSNGTTYYYKIAAVNNIGTSAKSSEASATPAGVTTMTTDYLTNWSLVTARSSNWILDTTSPAYFNGDGSRASRSMNDTEYLMYAYPGISTFSAKVYIYIGPIGTATFQVSTNNGSTYTTVPVTTGTETMSASGWGYYMVTPASSLPAGVTNLKVIFAAGTSNAVWDPQLSQISITHQ